MFGINHDQWRREVMPFGVMPSTSPFGGTAEENKISHCKLFYPLAFDAKVIGGLYEVMISTTTLACINDKLTELVRNYATHNNMIHNVFSTTAVYDVGYDTRCKIELATFEWHWWGKIHKEFDSWITECYKNMNDALRIPRSKL
jgi:hypothetical protein